MPIYLLFCTHVFIATIFLSLINFFATTTLNSESLSLAQFCIVLINSLDPFKL